LSSFSFRYVASAPDIISRAYSKASLTTISLSIASNVEINIEQWSSDCYPFPFGIPSLNILQRGYWTTWWCGRRTTLVPCCNGRRMWFIYFRDNYPAIIMAMAEKKNRDYNINIQCMVLSTTMSTRTMLSLSELSRSYSEWILQIYSLLCNPK